MWDQPGWITGVWDVDAIWLPFLFSVEFGDLWDDLGDFINMLMTKAESVIVCQCRHTIEICLNLINTGQIRVAIDLNTYI